MRSQKRRRAHAAASVNVPAPVVTNGFADWGRTLGGWADVLLDFTFADPGLPLAVFEIWWRRETIDAEFHLVGTTSSVQRSYIHQLATSTPVFAFYKLRYVNGGVVGPFSEELGVDI
jgi:hypothetical protein